MNNIDDTNEIYSNYDSVIMPNNMINIIKYTPTIENISLDQKLSYYIIKLKNY